MKLGEYQSYCTRNYDDREALASGSWLAESERMHKGQPDRLDKILVPLSIKIVLGIYVACVVIACFAYKVGEFDDAISLVHGMLIQEGRTPNLDFYSFYPPLGHYVSAAAFGLFGRSVFAVRTIDVTLYLGVLYLVARFFSNRFPHSRLLVSLAVLLVAASIGLTIVQPPWAGFAVSMAALLMYLEWICGGQNRIWLVVIGIVTGLAMLWRVNFGGYVAIVVAVDLLTQWWCRGKARWDRSYLTSDLKTAAAFVLPLVICWIGISLLIYGKHMGTAVSQFVIGAQRLMAMRGFIELRPTGDVVCAVTLVPAWFFFRILNGVETISVKSLVPVAFAVGFLALLIGARTQLSVVLLLVALEPVAVIALHFFVRRLERCEFCVLLYFCGLLHYFLVRADWDHERLLPIGAVMLVPFLTPSRFGPADPEGEFFVSKGTALAVLTAATFVFVTSDNFRPGAHQVWDGMRVLTSVALHPGMADADRVLGGALPMEGWEDVYTDADELQALRYVRSRTKSSEPIFVGVGDHSRVFWNNLRMYWLAERPIGVRLFQLEYKVATEAPFQQEIISDLERNKVKYIIIDCLPQQINKGESYLMEQYRGSKILDEYIRRNFQLGAQFGRYRVLGRIVDKGGPAPWGHANNGVTDGEDTSRQCPKAP